MEDACCSTTRRDRHKPQRTFLTVCAALLLLGGIARADKLSFDERVEIERGLTAEYAIAKISLPSGKKPLLLHSDGSYDKAEWQDAMMEGGPAARVGDQIQITNVVIEPKRILFEINGGGKGKGHWYDHVQVGVNGTNPNAPQNNGKNHGLYLALVFPGSVPPVSSDQIRQMLTPILDFDKRSASEQYVDRLPEPVKQAIKQQKAIQGMDKDEVLMAMGKPHNKSRETDKDGNEIEDWVYGEPPGKVTFVRFNEGKVVHIEDSYANIGGTTAPPLPEVR